MAEAEEHLVNWTIDGARRPGIVILAGDAPPTGLAVRLVDREGTKNYGLLGRTVVTRHPVVHGWMRTNRRIALVDAELFRPVLPDDYDRLRSSWALVGHDIAEDEPPRFRFVEADISGLDRIIWPLPAESVSWPGEVRRGSKFSLEIGETEHRWEEDGEVWKVSQRINFPLQPYYEFRVSFRPAVYIETESPLTVDELVEERLMPLTRLTAFLAAAEVRLHRVHLAPTPDRDEHGNQSGRVALFGPGIHQDDQPIPRFPHAIDDPRPLLRFDVLPMSLPRLVSRWRALELSDNPFLTLFETAKLVPPGAMTARYLALALALEGLDSHEHADNEGADLLAHEKHRKEALNELRSGATGASAKKFIQKNLARRPMYSLGGRFRRLLEWLPDDWLSELEVLSTNPLRQELVTANRREDFPDQLGRVRNRVAHGLGDIDVSILRPWVDALEWLARAHLLRLLGCDPENLPPISELRSP